MTTLLAPERIAELWRSRIRPAATGIMPQGNGSDRSFVGGDQ